MKIYVLCSSVDDLKRIAALGQAGLPYVPEWAARNLERRKSFPVYAQVEYHNPLGIVLNSIEETLPTQIEEISVTEFEEYVHNNGLIKCSVLEQS